MLPASDVFSFGIIVEECFLRKDPRRDSYDQRHLKVLAEAGSHFVTGTSADRRSSLAVDIPPHVAIMVTRCQHFDPDKRYEFSEVQDRLLELGETSVGKAFLRRGLEGRRQDRVLQQVRVKHRQ